MTTPPPVTIHRYGNGLTVLVREEPKHPVASLQFWVKTGSCHEGSRLGSGLSHLLEHMVFKGTELYSSQALAQKVQQLGGMWNAYTSTNRTVYYIEGPADSADTFLDILTQLVFHPSFPENELEKEKEVIRREMAMYDDDPDAVAGKLLMETLYKKHPRRYPVLGEPESFNLLNKADMLSYHEKKYCCNNVFVVVAGNVKTQNIISKLKVLTEDLIPGDLLLPDTYTESRQWGKRTARKEFPIPYSKLTLAWRIPHRNHPDSPALIALSHILSSGRSARLYRKFHDEMGVVHNITASISQGEEESGIFVISADVDRDQRDQVKQLILGELAVLLDADLDTDLARSIKKAKAARIKSMSTVSGLADGIANQWFHFGNTQYYQEWLEALEKITQADLKHVIKTYMNLDQITEVSLDPLNSNTEESNQASPSGKLTLHSHTLSHGLRIALREDNSLPMVHGCIAFKGGSAYESELSAGITSMLAECMLKGTTTRNSEEIADAFESLGGSINSSSGNNSLNIHFNCLAEDLKPCLEALADVIINATLPEDAFAHEKQAMISDAREQLEDPVSVAFDNLKAKVFGNVSYGLSTYGTVKSLSAITRENLIEHYQKLICTQNAVLSLAGDFNADEILPFVEQSFSRLKNAAPPVPSTAPEFHSGRIVETMDKEQSVLAVSMPGISVYSEDRLEAMLFQAWCSDMAGPVFTGIREEEGLAYFASSSLLIGLDTGMVIFYLGTSHELLEQAEIKLNHIIQNIREHGMNADDLERAKATALSSMMLSRQSNSTLSQQIALDMLYGYPADFFEQQNNLVSQISLADINNFIKKHLASSSPQTISIVQNK